MLLEIVRFTKADAAFTNVRPLRYCTSYDSDPVSLPYVARFHAKKVLKFQDAVLASYRKSEVIILAFRGLHIILTTTNETLRLCLLN